MDNNIRLSEIVSPVFSEPHKALKTGSVNQLILKGGRGSAKSSFASVEGILQIIKNPQIHGMVIRKVSNTLRTSVYAQYIWAITALGLYGKFKMTTQPMELTYKPTGQTIMFMGADDPGKLKSIKVQFGYIGFLHFEEIDQMSGEDEVRNIEQSILRGGDLAFEIKTFNPPKTKDNWANKYCMLDKPGQLIHHSTYLTTPFEWLGQRFVDDAEYLRDVNPAAYEHEYMGVPNGNGGMVFENVVETILSDELVASFDRVYSGADWGYYPDPFAFTRSYFDASRQELYIFDEIVINKQGNKETADLIKAKGLQANELIVCDSAEPKSIADYRNYGLNAVGAEKGAGSVDYSMKWLQSLKTIIIDRRRCPNTWEEFSSYEYDKNKNGDIISGYPDRDNHLIDATRYATEKIWKYRKTPRKSLLVG